jgi:tetratricopeptide (TPR) repeat protein
VGLWLSKGTNRLVIRTAIDSGAWSLFVRLTRPDGGPLRGIEVLSTFPDSGVAAGKRRAVRRVQSVEGWLEGREEVRLRALHQARGVRLDPSSKEAEEVLEGWIEQQPTVEGYLLLARSRREANERLDALERARKLAPGDLWVRARLARWMLQQGRRLRAARQLDRLRGFLPAELERAESLREAGLTRLAAAALDGLLARYPRVGRVLLERASLALEHDDVVLGDRLHRRYLRRRQDDPSTLRTLASLAIRRGDGAAALRLYDRALRVAPNLAFLRVDRARLLAGGGKLTEAVAEYRRALRVDPRSVRVLEELGRVLLRARDRAGAWAAFRQALAIRPQNADLRAYMAFLDPRRRRGAAERHRVELGPLIRAAHARPLPGDVPAEVLLDLTATEVHENGLSRTLRQRVTRVATTAGARQVASHAVRFNPDRQVLQIRAARVHRPGGEVFHSALQLEQDGNEPWAGLWYDIRTRVIRFAGLRPGDVVEIEYLLEDVAQRNLFADYFGDLVYLQEELPVRRFAYVLVTPGKRRFYFRHPRRPGVRHEARERGETRVYSWTARDLPRIVVEPSMPGWSEVSDYIHASTYRDWDEVVRWYRGLIRPQLRATTAVSAQARRLTRGLTAERDKIRAIHNYVAKTTRYVGLEFGIHSYKPYAAAQVLARKFGDCKDKAALMVALLGEVGVPAELVLVRTRDRGRVETTPASLAPFNHAVVYLPGQRLYVDATEEFAGTTELPLQDQGVMALHVARRGGGLHRTPLAPAARNLSRTERVIRIAADGAVRIAEKRTIGGHLAARWRERYQAADHRRQRYERSWNAVFGGARVIRVAMPGLEDLERPVRVEAELAARGMALRTGPRRLSILPTGLESNLVGAHARLSKRRHPLVLKYPRRLEERVRLEPPPGWRFADPPPLRAVRSSFGSYSRAVRREGRALVVERTLELTVDRVSPVQYPAFRQFLQRVDRHAAERLSLER